MTIMISAFVISFTVCLLLTIKIQGLFFGRNIIVPANRAVTNQIVCIISILFQVWYWAPELMRAV